MKKHKENEENYVIFIMCIRQYHMNDLTKEKKMGGACTREI
jgi:hypothetical protein